MLMIYKPLKMIIINTEEWICDTNIHGHACAENYEPKLFHFIQTL